LTNDKTTAPISINRSFQSSETTTLFPSFQLKSSELPSRAVCDGCLGKVAATVGSSVHAGLRWAACHAIRQSWLQNRWGEPPPCFLRSNSLPHCSQRLGGRLNSSNSELLGALLVISLLPVSGLPWAWGSCNSCIVKIPFSPCKVPALAGHFLSPRHGWAVFAMLWLPFWIQSVASLQTNDLPPHGRSWCAPRAFSRPSNTARCWVGSPDWPPTGQ